MHELSKVRRDIVSRHYQTLREVRDKVASLYRRSEESNGPRHEVTLHMNNALEVVDTLVEETTTEVDLVELAEPLDEQMLDSAEPSADSDKPQALSKRGLYVKQRKDDYLAGKPTQHKRPRNLVAERILERTGELLEIESEDADADADEEAADESEVDEGDEDERGFSGAQLCRTDVPKGYTDNLRDLPKDPPTLKQINALNEARLLGPNFQIEQLH